MKLPNVLDTFPAQAGEARVLRGAFARVRRAGSAALAAGRLPRVRFLNPDRTVT